MSSKARIVATLTEVPTPDLLASLSGRAEILEVRADLVKGLDPDWLRSHFSGSLLYTLRSRDEGGQSESSLERRHERLLEAGSQYDFIDLEMAKDLTSDLLPSISPAQRILSWHGPPTTLAKLQVILERMLVEEAHLYKIIPAAEQPRQEMAPLALLRSIGRQDVVAFASGDVGTWTRLIAPRLGAPVMYGAASDQEGAPGQLTVNRLVTDFLAPDLEEVHEVFGLVGLDIGHSLSPRLHNSLYRDLHLPFLYLPFPVESFGEFWLEVVESGALQELGLDLHGLSVTSPYKRIASAVAGASSPLVEWLGSANTLVNRNSVWEAESTDGDGIAMPLRERIADPSGAPAAVLGAGGAGCAAAVALQNMGADVTLVNRSVERGRKAAKELRLPFRELEGFDPEGMRIVVHATPLGRSDSDPLPLDPSRLAKDAVLVDMVYREAAPTRLVSETRLAGREAIDGREVLVAQAMAQFSLMTGREMPLDRAREIVGLE